MKEKNNFSHLDEILSRLDNIDMDQKAININYETGKVEEIRKAEEQNIETLGNKEKISEITPSKIVKEQVKEEPKIIKKQPTGNSTKEIIFPNTENYEIKNSTYVVQASKPSVNFYDLLKQYNATFLEGINPIVTITSEDAEGNITSNVKMLKFDDTLTLNDEFTISKHDVNYEFLTNPKTLKNRYSMIKNKHLNTIVLSKLLEKNIEVNKIDEFFIKGYSGYTVISDEENYKKICTYRDATGNTFCEKKGGNVTMWGIDVYKVDKIKGCYLLNLSDVLIRELYETSEVFDANVVRTGNKIFNSTGYYGIDILSDIYKLALPTPQ